jgi:hypothetical protein
MSCHSHRAAAGRLALIVLAVLSLALGACGGGSEDPPPTQDAQIGCQTNRECDDQNTCTNDVCEAGICQNKPSAQAEGEACDDGLACTVDTVCQAGQCVGQPLDCGQLGDVCNDGICSETAGGCTVKAKADGTTCDDAKFCTTTDVCTAGVCGGAPRDCSAQDGACTVGTCDEAQTACVAKPVADGQSCDDGLACTGGDQCTAGVCGGGAIDCSGVADACNVGMCDEQTGACIKVAANEGGSCDDGLFCTVTDACQAGVCAGSARSCGGVADACNAGVCDETQDACVKQAANDGASCDDGLFCTVSDVCGGGACAGTTRDCSAFSDTCNLGTCNEGQDACVKVAANEGGTCSDGLFCSVGDRCTAGACTPTGPRACGDSDACTTDTCNDVSDQCDHVVTPVPGAEGPPGSASCGDGVDNDCDGETDLVDANCQGCITAGDCDDQNPCTADSCNVGTCINTAQTGPVCNDGNFCTVSDTCQAGVCGGAPRDCSGVADQCNTGSCDEAGDACVKSPKASGTVCSDGAFCTVNDSCQAGACQGSARDCSGAADQCNSGACNEAQDACVKVPLAGSPACNDGAFCTVNDTCQGGTCQGAARDCTAAADACNNGVCDEGGDACTKSPKPDSTPCDTLFCSVGETCQGGQCVGGSPTTACGDGNTCTVDACDEGQNQCVNTPRTVDTNSPVFSTSTDATPLGVCLVAGSGARTVVWTELRDGAGQPLGGATVSIGGAPATEATAAPGAYYREVVAGPNPGTQVLSVSVVACGQSVMLADQVTVTLAAANTGSGGTGGCSSADGNLRVKVIAAETLAPIAGAQVLVGQAQGTPFAHGPEAPLGGPAALSTNIATTDAQGFATFYDYGTALGTGFTVTAGAAGRAYFTIADARSSDLVLALPLLHPPAPATATYSGTGPATSDSNCDTFDAGFVLPKLSLDFFSAFDVGSLFERNRCYASNNNIVGTIALPSNLWIPGQSIGPFCLGGSIAQAPWALTLKKSPPLENIAVAMVTVPVSAVQNILNSGGVFTDLLPVLTYRKLGWNLNENVVGDVTGRMLGTQNDTAGTVTITYSGRPAETDIVGITGADYSGQNGSGATFLLGSAVHKFGDPGSTVAVPNAPLSGSAPQNTRRFASVAALYLNPAAHPMVPVNRQKGLTSVLLRGGQNPPFGSGNASLTASGMLGIAGTTFTAPATFAWENATANGNAPLYSVHQLSVRETQYLPVLSCQTTNDKRERLVVQWIVAKPFGATCSGGRECFTLPTLPASFPRAGAAPQQKSGFEAVLGSGLACTGSGQGSCSAGEQCVDPDAGGANARLCVTGAGTEADPYVTRDYHWRLEIFDLELLASWAWSAFNFADKALYLTHESTHTATFQ